MLMHLRRLVRLPVLLLFWRWACGAQAAAKLEVGLASAPDNTCWNTVTFAEAFDEAPVVVVMTRRAGSTTAKAFVRSVTSTSFELCISEPHYANGVHEGTGWMNFLAASPGVHMLPDGRILEAGRVETTQRQAADCRPLDFPTRGWEELRFLHTFGEPPVLLTEVQTANNLVTHYPFVPWLVAAVQSLTSASAQVVLDSSKAAFDGGQVSVSEQIGYIAFEAQPATTSAQISASSLPSPIPYAMVKTAPLANLSWDDGGQTIGYGRTLSSYLVVASASTGSPFCFYLFFLQPFLGTST